MYIKCVSKISLMTKKGMTRSHAIPHSHSAQLAHFKFLKLSLNFNKGFQNGHSIFEFTENFSVFPAYLFWCMKHYVRIELTKNGLLT